MIEKEYVARSDLRHAADRHAAVVVDVNQSRSSRAAFYPLHRPARAQWTVVRSNNNTHSQRGSSSQWRAPF